MQSRNLSSTSSTFASNRNRNFNNSKPDAYYNAYHKALDVNPTVIALDTPLAYAVEGSDGDYYIVELAPADNGELEGATCECKGGSHMYCYHRHAAWLYHTERIVVSRRMGRPLNFTAAAAPSSQSENPGICRETGCEMDSMCPSYKICSQQSRVAPQPMATTFEVAITLSVNWGSNPQHSVAASVVPTTPPATATAVRVIGGNTAAAAATATTTTDSKGPLCRHCHVEITFNNRARGGLCSKCWDAQIAEDSSDLFG